jgi:ribosome maturation factor RimP
MRAGVHQTIEQTVLGLGYDLVDVERAGRGLLRVTIDRRPGGRYPGGDGEFVTVDDCEAVTRQLQYVLEVEGVDYERLEVSSPGLDRPLRRAEDFARFAGSEITLTLRAPFQGRKHWKGRLAASEGDRWGLHFEDGGQTKVLDFALDEVREARLVPVVDFKGRRGRAATPPEADGGL